MSDKGTKQLVALLERLNEEQARTNLYTIALERARLFSALLQAGLGTPVFFTAELAMAVGATTTITQLVPQGFVYIFMGPMNFYNSLPWWCTCDVWLDTTTPATPQFSANRMPEVVSTPDYGGYNVIRAFQIFTVTNNHLANLAYTLIQTSFLAVTVETWEMIQTAYVDRVVADLRETALEKSGIQR